MLNTLLERKEKLSINGNARLFFSIILIVVSFDQFTKYLVVKGMQVGDSIPIIQNIFHLTFLKNTGAGFSILTNSNMILIWFMIIIIGIIFWNLPTIETKLYPYVALLVGGAFGNLIDRIFRSGVVDFFDFRIWPVFNIADSCITISGIVLIFFMIKKK